MLSKKTKFNQFVILASALCMTIGYAALLILSKAVLIRITQEDNVYENITAITLFLAALVSIYLFRSSHTGNDLFFLKTKKNIFFLLLAILFIFCTGEEISWGQRIFRWSTPESFGKYNLQNETNIHNLNFWGSNENRLVATFLLGWTILIPLFYKIFNPIKILIKKMNIPFGSLWIGFLFFINYIITFIVRYYIPANNGPRGIRSEEIREFSSSILFLALLLVIFKKEKDLKTNLDLQH